MEYVKEGYNSLKETYCKESMDLSNFIKTLDLDVKEKTFLNLKITLNDLFVDKITNHCITQNEVIENLKGLIEKTQDTGLRYSMKLQMDKLVNSKNELMKIVSR